MNLREVNDLLGKPSYDWRTGQFNAVAVWKVCPSANVRALVVAACRAVGMRYVVEWTDVHGFGVHCAFERRGGAA